MKNAIILHGTGGTPESFWFPYMKHAFIEQGYSVSIPQLPDADYPDLKLWLPVALKESYSPETVLIGHSAGGPLQLSVLENIRVKIRLTILVAGYARPKGAEKKPEKILQATYNWKSIADHTEDIIFLNSDSDPWGCDDIEGRYMLDHVGKGKLIVMKGEGHMGSDSFNQPYRTFPFLAQLIS